jgi:VWFA-related protein
MAAACAAGMARAQNAGGERTVIRTETRVVLVDAVVTDKSGNYVHGLSSKDFRVWEDNKEQKITGVAFQAEAAPPQQKGNLILLFDNASMDSNNQILAKQAAVRLLELPGGEDRLTVVAAFGSGLSIIQNFTGDAERLKQAVAKLPPAMGRHGASPQSGGFASAETGYNDDGWPGPGPAPGARASARPGNLAGTVDDAMVRSFLYSLASLARNVAAVPGRKTLVLFTAGFAIKAPIMTQFQAAINACNRANLAVYPVDARGLGPFRGSLGGGGGIWAGLLRNSGLAFAGGPALSVASLVTAALATGQGAPSGQTAPAGQTPVGGGQTPPVGGNQTPPVGGGQTSPIGGRGGVLPSPPEMNSPGSRGATNPTPGGMPGIQTMAMDVRSTLDSLASGTGGFVIRNTNDLLDGLQKIVKEQQEYYLLSYTPADSSKQSCHELRVKVSGGGNAVRSRSGYCFTASVDVLTGTPAERDLQSRLSGSGAGGAAGSMQLPFFYSAPNTARVNLAMEIPSKPIRFEKVKGKFHAEVNVLAMAYGAEGQIAARSSDALKLDFDNQAAVDAFQAQPLHYENQFEMGPGRYNLKVAFGQTGGAYGTLESPLTIEPYDGSQLGMSALTLSRQTKPAPDDSSVSIAMMEGRTPLVARNLQYTPAGENSIPQGERFRIYFEVYDPQLLSGGSAVTAHVATSERKSGRELNGADLGDLSGYARPGTNTIALGLAIPVLPPGSYRTEMKVSNSSGNSAVRSVEFEVR